MHWEYKAVTTSATGFWAGGKIDSEALIQHLNHLGAQGWELVSVFDTNMHRGETRDVFAILKRQASEMRLSRSDPAAN